MIFSQMCKFGMSGNACKRTALTEYCQSMLEHILYVISFNLHSNLVKYYYCAHFTCEFAET